MNESSFDERAWLPCCSSYRPGVGSATAVRPVLRGTTCPKFRCRRMPTAALPAPPSLKNRAGAEALVDRALAHMETRGSLADWEARPGSSGSSAGLAQRPKSSASDGGSETLPSYRSDRGRPGAHQHWPTPAWQTGSGHDPAYIVVACVANRQPLEI